MQTKTLEVRDAATFIPVLAIQVSGADGFLIRSAGFQSPMVELIHLEGQKCAYDPYDWGNRTMQVAHDYIATHWDELKERDVIDVEFILGESTTKKQSEELAER